MSKKKLKRPEVLAPAGTLEKLKVAVLYGADAVFVGGQQYGLRSRAGNFSMEEMEEGINFAHEHSAKVYVAANMVTHEGNEEGAGQWFRDLRDMGLDAVIVSDPALIEICATEAPGLDIHLSTQASATNVETFNFWSNYGLTRVVLAREVNMKELAEIRRRTDVEIEAFVHGAMCISYSGRCTLSNHMSHRDANRGGCSQSCRWKYDLYDMPFGQERRSLKGEIPEEYSMSAVDMCMIEHIPDMIENGVDSLKIEGRMKSIHYVSTVSNCYKAAVDAYMESPEAFYAIKDDLVDELWKVAQRELATGFYYSTPTENEQLFGARCKIPQYKFVAEVVSFNEKTMTATLRQRNVIKEGDRVEFYGPGFRHFEATIEDLHDAEGNKIDRAPNPMELLSITLPQPVKAGDMVRSCEEGLINLYQEDGRSQTIRA
ncbi:peptidase U32 family protein [Streptococcus dentapri]|uniref:U32 family peptidase n=1 Tax=Streptococcus dentapri TaxID=573564 RepID=A0ABV8D0B6_9STRE